MVDLATPLVHSQEGAPDTDFVQLAVLLGLHLQICRWSSRGVSGVGMGKMLALLGPKLLPALSTQRLTAPRDSQALPTRRSCLPGSRERDWLPNCRAVDWARPQGHTGPHITAGDSLASLSWQLLASGQ